jgi:capsular polysaccharide biosynthesis protein
MELKEYIAMFQKQIKWFWMTVILFIIVAGIWQQNQSSKFQAILLLNIGRAGTQMTQDYTYDSFYRLQADERFSDTVVRWLGSPRVVEDIYTTVGIPVDTLSTKALSGVFGAKRLSSQMIEVTYSDSNENVLQKISEATITELNTYTNSLNKENGEKNWFVVIGSDPVIRDVRITFPFALVVALALGVFIGFWVALVKHYFSDSK